MNKILLKYKTKFLNKKNNKQMIIVKLITNKLLMKK